MAHQMEKRWENADGKRHVEEQISAVKAKQGRTGARILMVLVVALILAFVVWIPVEIWGNREADEVAPQQPGQELQSQSPVPTETPNAQLPAPNAEPVTPATPAPSQPAQ
ncbi:hypothetical protein [Rhizobium mongolense]|uniref:Cytoskeletal protein RodZ n=1 Tax=Rhizobium mongolense TaxID=57676 RepID=A0A7W6RM96_9HYPH|nr:hypothetical protein [Rhizobium mongolense]MBB4275022.1 cytoskeletal protein RodZ [Rhizobium mongolense]